MGNRDGMERRHGGCVTGSCLGLGDEKGQCPGRFSPALTPLCRVLPASWSLLPHPGEQATPSAQYTTTAPFPNLGSPSASLIPNSEPHKAPTSTRSPSPSLVDAHDLRCVPHC